MTPGKESFDLQSGHDPKVDSCYLRTFPLSSSPSVEACMYHSPQKMCQTYHRVSVANVSTGKVYALHLMLAPDYALTES